MNKLDPAAPDMNALLPKAEGWRVEEVAQLATASISVAEDLTKTAELSRTADPAAKGVASVEPASLSAAATQTMNNVSGRYRGRLGEWELELRVDVDGWWPMQTFSGDFYHISGATVTYYGSFFVSNPSIQVTATQVIMEGVMTRSWSGNFPKLQVTIARTSTSMAPAPARAQFLTLDNRAGGNYICAFESFYFRTVEYEQDQVEGITPFSSYDTASLPSGGFPRVLWVAKAYAEVGIQILYSRAWNIVPIAGAGVNAAWSDAELHAAMERQFSLWRNEPQWKVWLLAAGRHERGSTLLGIMFDQQGQQRQGCAVFHDTPDFRATDAASLRYQLHTYVHELGHCFNLVHSFEKNLLNPPMPNRPDALSWMNYPWKYQPAGSHPLTPSAATSAFWAAFRYLFDGWEVSFLRHAFRNNIIMGGLPFGTGAAMEAEELFATPVADNSGLKLELEARQGFALGEPVVVEVKLRTMDLRGKTVNSSLHPNSGFVKLAIQKPGGQILIYRPLITHCVHDETTRLDAECPAIYESAYIGYGKDGFYFDHPGFYRLRAIYHALDGSIIVSNPLTLKVSAPLASTDEEVADLYFGNDQGKLLYLLGSDSAFLQGGNDAFDLLLDKHGEHPLAVYAKMAKGVNASRAFKSLTAEKQFVTRQTQTTESVKLLSAVVDASEAGQGVDNITLNMTMRCMARAQKSAGDEQGAKSTGQRMVNIFRAKALKPHVLRVIEAQAAAL